jgi:hypothetical protein
MSMPRLLKVFVASPSDVIEERNALDKLIGDINDVLVYLAPEKQLRLELVRYETHAYPDLGKPQEVINREIPVDYDIFVGIMWKRAGTPTGTADSGTIEEFERARRQREKGSLPRIMFYFCDQPMPVPTPAELEQLAKVVEFRNKLSGQGLTSSYPSHAEFGEHIRGGLLRAIRDILREGGESIETEAPPQQSVDTASQEVALSLAHQYEEIRRTMGSGDQRTQVMSGVFSKMKALAAKVRGLLTEFASSDSPGKRLMAIAILDMFPSAEKLDWLSERLNLENEKPFVAYQAAVALLEAVVSLPTGQCADMKRAVARAKAFAVQSAYDPSRINVLARAEQELQRRCGNK